MTNNEARTLEERELLRYAQQLATYAAKKFGCVPEWKPLDDVAGCLSQIDNCLTGLERPVPQPLTSGAGLEGWRLVPVYPTPEMLNAAPRRGPDTDSMYSGIYRAMLAAAPPPPMQPTVGEGK